MDEVYQCACGNIHFTIRATWLYCVKCAKTYQLKFVEGENQIELMEPKKFNQLVKEGKY